MVRWGFIDLTTNLLASTDSISIKLRIPHYVLPIFYATFRSHKTIRSMHRCPPQLNRPLLNPESLVPRVFFYFFVRSPCPVLVQHSVTGIATSFRGSPAFLAILFFPSPWRIHWGRASCTTASQSARGKLVKVLYFSHNSVSINSPLLNEIPTLSFSIVIQFQR